MSPSSGCPICDFGITKPFTDEEYESRLRSVLNWDYVNGRPKKFKVNQYGLREGFKFNRYSLIDKDPN